MFVGWYFSYPITMVLGFYTLVLQLYTMLWDQWSHGSPSSCQMILLRLKPKGFTYIIFDLKFICHMALRLCFSQFGFNVVFATNILCNYSNTHPESYVIARITSHSFHTLLDNLLIPFQCNRDYEVSVFKFVVSFLF